MKKLLLFSIISLSFIPYFLQAQCPPVGFPSPGFTCTTAPILCPDLDGYCANTGFAPSVVPPAGFPGCNGFQINNPIWFAFFAGTSTITMNITSANCIGGTGIQAGIYNQCISGVMDVQCNSSNNFILTSNNFIPGNIYYIVIDGFSGADCDIFIDVTQGSTVQQTPANPGLMTGPDTVCVNSSANYSIPPVQFATTYTWAVNPGLGTTNGSIGPTTNVSYGNTPGSTDVCVLVSNQCLSNPTPSCTTVEVIPLPTATLSGSAVYCQNNPQPYDLTVDFTGAAPWRFVYTINGVPQPAITTSQNPYILTVNQPGTIALSSVISNIVGAMCQGQVSGNVQVTQTNIVISPSVTPASCGLDNGAIDLSVSGGASPYHFDWSIGSTDEDLTGLFGNQNYQVTVSDDNGCTSTASITLPDNQVAISVPGVVVSNTNCNGTGNGSINITPTPPNPNYVINWSNSSTDEDLTDLLPGTYTVTVTQGNNCTQEATFVVPNMPNTPNISAVPTASICNLANGSIDLTVNSGLAPFVFSWSNSDTNEDLVDIPPGTYTVTVTGDDGCTNTASTTISNTNPLVSIASTILPNTTCTPGSENGSISITISPASPQSGVPNYGISWSNGATDITMIDNLPSGTYTVTVDGGGACTNTASFTVPDMPDEPVPTAVATNAICALANGSVDLSVTGGVSPYTFSWSNSDTNEDLVDVQPGTYTVTVTGDNGCTNTASATVGNTDPPVSIAPTIVPNTACTPGAENGSISITISPAAPPSGAPNYGISWSNGATDVTMIDNLPSGTYTVTVDGGGACTSTASFTVPNMPDEPMPTAVATNAFCALANGSVDLGVTGGVSPYTFSWSNSDTNEDLVDVPPGTYTVTVTGDNGCTNTASATVGNTDPPISISPTIVANTACTPGAENGSISITISPASPPSGAPNYGISWSNGATDVTMIDNLPSGTYTVTVDGGGACTSTASFTVPNMPDEPMPSAIGSDATCSLTNGSVDLSVTGGISPYTFSWSNGSTDEDLTDVAPGTYTVTVTGDNGCTQTTSATVGNQNPPINITGTTNPNTSCLPGIGDGTISMNISPVTPPGAPNYGISWSNGVLNQTNLIDLPSGTYTVTVDGGGSCTSTASFTIANDPNTPAINLSPSEATCGLANGFIDALVSGGVPNFTFLWSNGETTQDIFNVLPGSYTLTVTGDNGCTAAATTVVDVDNPAIFIDPTIQANEICTPNIGNGSISLTISPDPSPSGNPYTFIWSNGEITQDIVDISNGSYSVTVSSGGSCTSEATFMVPLAAQNPNITLNTNPATCGQANGSIFSNVFLGHFPYTYQWSNGDTDPQLVDVTPGSYTLTVTDDYGCTVEETVDLENDNPEIELYETLTANTTCMGNNGSIELEIEPQIPPGGQPSYTILWSNGATGLINDNLPAGTYLVTVSSGGSCTAEGFYEIDDLINLPTLSSTVMDAICGNANGSISLTTGNGNAPYFYLWNTGSFDENLTNIAAGNYSVTVTDAEDCTASLQVTVPNQTVAFSLNATLQTNTNCTQNNGAIDLTVSPSGSYFYAWSSGATTEDLSNVAPGTYTITVSTDSGGAGCTATASYTILDTSLEPTVDLVFQPATCGEMNGSIDLTVLTGNAPLAFLWSNAATSEDLSNLTAGTYTVTVTGQVDCSATFQVVVPNNAVNFSATPTIVQNTSCASPNGSISLQMTPAQAGLPAGLTYSYIWSSGETTQNLSAIPSGPYSVTVSTGTSGCSQTYSYTVVNNAIPPSANAAATATTCGEMNGAINLTTTGGTAPLSFVWSNTATSEDLTNLGTGTYTVTVSDVNSCTTTASAMINNNNFAINITETIFNNTSCATPNGSINIALTPTNPPNGTYTYAWSNSTSNQNITGMAPGIYSVTVNGGGTCTASASFQIDNQTSNPILTPTVSPTICGDSNGAIDLTVTPTSAGPFSFIWSNSAVTEDLSNLSTGNYTVTVTDANSCQSTRTINVPNNSSGFTVSGTESPVMRCDSPNGAVDLMVTPASGSYTFAWSNGATTQDLTNLLPGTYTVTVNESGPVSCPAEASFTILDNRDTILLSKNLSPAECGLPTGSYNLSVLGGMMPYSYLWSNTATSQDLQNVLPGLYSVTVSDPNGCTAENSGTIDDNSLNFSINETISPNTSCGTNTGAIDLTITPMGSYTFLWSSGETSEDLSATGGGAYTVTVSAGGNCTAVQNFTIPTTTLDPIITNTNTPDICGQSLGAINLDISGGQGPFTFTWSNGAISEDLTNVPAGAYNVTVTGSNACSTSAAINLGNNSINISLAETLTPNTSCAVPNGAIDLSISPAGTYNFNWATGETSQNLSNLASGDYTVTVTLGTSCSASETFEIIEQTGAPNLTADLTDDVCNAGIGAIDLSATGAQPITFIWSNTATSEDLNGLNAGTYSITATDANGCVSDETFSIANNSNTFSFSGITGENTLCVGGNGTIDLTITPSSPSYGFAWSNGVASEDLTDLEAGMYSVTISDAGCTAVGNFTITNNTDAPQINQTVQPSVCGLPTGSIDLMVTGGQGPYSFLWDNAAITEDIDLLVDAAYTVTVTDANNCTSEKTISISATTITIGLMQTVTPNTLCGVNGNGAIDLSISPAGNYSILWDSGQNTEDIDNLSSGNYTVTVSTGTSCSMAQIVFIPDDINLPTVQGQATADICNGGVGSIDINPMGAAPFTFIWSNAAVSEDLTDLMAGSYTVTATDANGCTDEIAFTVGNNSNTFTFTGLPEANTLCSGFNGAVNITVNPAGTNYIFSWSNGASSEDLSAIGPGNYTVTISDGGTCTAEATYTVNNDSPAPTVIGQSTNIVCFGEMTGALQLQTMGGQPPYSFDWMPMVTNPQNPSGLAAGSYTLTLSDAANCSTTATYTITQPSAPLTISCQMAQGASMPGAQDGAGRVTISGGTALYRVDWEPGGAQMGVAAGDFNIISLSDGTYTVTVTDANDCSTTCSFTVAATACTSAVGEMGVSALSACENACITATYDASNAFLDADDLLEFILHTGDANQIVGELARNTNPVFCFDAGTMTIGETYYISAVVGNADLSGNVDLDDFCTVISAGTPISFSEIPTASIQAVQDLDCINREVQITGLSSIPNAIFSWETSNGLIVGNANQASINAGQTGLYTFIINANGCADTSEITVQDLSNTIGVFITADPASQLDCIVETVTLTANVSGSNTMTYEWINDGNTLGITSTLLVEASGLFDLIVLDTLTFCTDTASIEIVDGQVYPPLNAATPAPLSCITTSTLLSGSSPVSGLDYQWILVENVDTTLIGTAASAQATQAGNYWLIGVDPTNGCTNAIPLTVDADIALPTADAGVAFTLDCLNPVEFLDGSASLGSATLAFAWSTQNGELVSGENTATPGISLGGTYILLVTDSGNGCTDTDEVDILTTGPSFTPLIVEPRCFGEKGSFNLSQVSGGTPPYRYSINGGTTLSAQTTYTNVAPGNYTLLIQDNLGCTDFQEVILTEPSLLSLALEPFTVISLGDSYQILAQSTIPESDLASILWTPIDSLTCSNCLNPIASPSVSTYYELTIEDSLGCVASERINIEVQRGGIYAPTVFNPGAATDNYVWTLFADLRNIKNIQTLQIFDRWGTMVFQNNDFPPNDLTRGWDGYYNGKMMNPAVFVWYAKVEYIDGLVELVKGEVTLVR